MTLKLGPDMTYFAWSMGAGLLIAVIYDLLRVSRRFVKTPPVVVNIEDIVFAVFIGLLAVFGAYAVNNGSFRIYSIFVMGLVFMLYRMVVSDKIVTAVSALCVFFAKAIRLIFTPILALVKGAEKSFGKICGIFDLKKRGK